MSRIDELISHLCPEGVRGVPLNELFEVRNGYTPSKANPEYWEGGTIPWFRMDDIRATGRVLDSAKQNITESAVQGRRLFEANSLIICTTATIGEHALITSAFVANQQFTILTPSNTYKEQALPKYLYFYGFKLAEFTKTITNSSGYATVDMAKFKKFRFLLPPLEVQQEIVRILDTFTGLEAELEAELEARKKQYEHYRNTLLSFPEQGVRWVPMGEVCSLKIGEFVKKTKQDKNAEFPVYNGGTTPTGYYKQANSPGKSVVISARGSIGFVNFLETDFWAGNSCYVIRPTNEDLNVKFLYHYLKANEDLLYSLRAVGTIPALNLKPVQEVKIPLLSLELQIEISKKLDLFSELTNVIESGLPAEIEARRKQYEHYRDRLLTFKELAA